MKRNFFNFQANRRCLLSKSGWSPRWLSALHFPWEWNVSLLLFGVDRHVDLFNFQASRHWLLSKKKKKKKQLWSGWSPRWLSALPCLGLIAMSISSISKLVGVACSQKKKKALKWLIAMLTFRTSLFGVDRHVDLFNFQASRRWLLSKKKKKPALKWLIATLISSISKLVGVACSQKKT